MFCPICESNTKQTLLFENFVDESFGHIYCKNCGASYDSNIDQISRRSISLEDITSIDSRESYRDLFVETWEISNEEDEIYTDFGWSDQEQLKDGITRHATNSIEKHLSNSDIKLLDLGCGDGFTTRKFSNLYSSSNVIGLDPSPSIKNTSVKHGIQGIQGTLETVEFDSNHFDVVVIIGNLMLHHDIRFTLRESHRITKSGGLVIFDFKNINTMSRRLARRLAILSPKLSKNHYVQRNFINMRYGLNRSHISKLLGDSSYDILEVYDKPPRLLEFENGSALSSGLKGVVWRFTDFVDKLFNEQAWIQTTLRVNK